MAGGGFENRAGSAGAYRPDIDGLRALAVLPVTFYHADVPGFGGGFVGVDVFFVISGFLITRIIVAGVTTRAFSYAEFYERRARRLAPALILVALAVVLFTLLFRSPRDADIFGESVTLFSIFSANFFFYDQLDYFGDPVEFYPLLHMWSLAVEEQFYLFFPPLVAAIWAGARARTDRLFWALAVIAAASFLAAVAVVRFDPQLAFFHTPFRIWELLAGGLLALNAPAAGAAARGVAAWVGLGLIAASTMLYQSGMPFPGAAAAPPVAGAALLIWCADPRTLNGSPPPFVSRVLSAPPLVFVGLVSYGFYLWHWPALSAARYMSSAPLTLAEALGVLSVAFALSVATLYAVERPFRRPGAILSRRGVFAVCGGTVASLLLIGFLLQESRGWPGRFPGLEPLLSEDATKYGPRAGVCAPAQDRVDPALAAGLDPSFCLLHGAGAGRPTALLWGDSHLWALAPGLRLWAEAQEVTVYVAWSPICAPLIGYDRPGPTRFHDCGAHNAAAPAVAEALRVDAVVLAAQWSRYADALGDPEILAATARRLRDGGAAVMAVSEPPSFDGHPPTALFRAAATGAAPALDLTGAADRLKEPSRAAIGAAATAAAIPVVPLADVFCDAARCRVAAANGASFFADSHHLSRIGARAAAPWLLEQLAPFDL